MTHTILKNTLTTCSNCEKSFSKIDENSVLLQVTLDNDTKEYFYCSHKCYHAKLSNINSSARNFELRLKIVSTSIVREKPLFVRMVTRVEDFKLDTAYVS